MKKLSKSYLRDIILEEIRLLNEELEIDSIMKRVLSEESWDTRNKYNDIHHAENLKDDERDEFEHGDVAAAEEDKRHEDDLYYDAHDDKEDDHHHHHRHDEGDQVDEVLSVDNTDNNSPGFNSMSAPDVQAEEEKEAGSLNIGESTITNKTIDYDKYLSRGALYRKRYYGRY
jgi:hypothetical protein